MKSHFVELGKLENERLFDYFAGQAITGILSNPNLSGMKVSDMAVYAFTVADVMFNEKIKKKEGK